MSGKRISVGWMVTVPGQSGPISELSFTDWFWFKISEGVEKVSEECTRVGWMVGMDGELVWLGSKVEMLGSVVKTGDDGQEMGTVVVELRNVVWCWFKSVVGTFEVELLLKPKLSTCLLEK